jgi:hypothetical protein
MKKQKKLLREIWMERHGFLQLFAYFLTIGWYGYVLRIVISSDINLFFTILLVAGGIILGLFTCLSLHEAFSEDDE